MFIIETGNSRNANVNKHDLRQSAKVKNNILNTKMTNIKLYKMKNVWDVVVLNLYSCLQVCVYDTFELSFSMTHSIHKGYSLFHNGPKQNLSKL